MLGDRRDPRVVLAEAFDAPMPTSGPPRAAILWGRVTLDAAGVPAERRVEAIAALRRDLDLGLRPTKYLVDHLATHYSR